MKKISDFKVTIVGLGLMGGSLALAIKPHCKSMIGMDKNPDALRYAANINCIDQGTDRLDEVVVDTDLVILAVPVRKIMDILGELKTLPAKECIVMDIGSTKRQINQQLSSLPDHFQVLGGHPLCGKETAGIQAADAGLFNRKNFILTPLPRTSQETLTFIQELIRLIGAEPIIMTPDRQDRATALVSHLPYLLACGLYNIAMQNEEQESKIWEIASSGFKDTTRLASSDVEMMLDILLTNPDYIDEAIEIFTSQMEHFSKLIASEEDEKLRGILLSIQNHRNRIYQ